MEATVAVAAMGRATAAVTTAGTGTSERVAVAAAAVDSGRTKEEVRLQFGLFVMGNG